MRNRCWAIAQYALLLGLSVAPAAADLPGITDTEIKIGQSAPFSGPASVYGQISTANPTISR